MMGKQGSVPAPTELPPAGPKTSHAKTDLAKKGQYDSVTTANYLLQQLPTELESGVTFSSEEWQEAFSPLDIPTPVVRRQTRQLAAETATGPANVLSWTINENARRHGAYVDHDKFGYDENGHVYKLDIGLENSDSLINEQIQLNTDKSPAPPATSWVGQHFGSEWRFGIIGVCDDPLLSTAALQLCRGADFDKAHDEYASLAPARLRLAQCFVSQFKGKWDPLSRNRWGVSYQPWTGSAKFKSHNWNDLVLQYHMRVFTVPVGRIKLPGEGLKRAQGKLWASLSRDDAAEGHSSRKSLQLIESRCSVGLKTTWRLDFPVFSLVTMADSTTTSLKPERLQQLGNPKEWEKANIHPTIRATGIAAFAFRIQSLLPQWETQWSRLIDDVESFLNADLENILSPERRREMMVDNNDLELSDLYFAVIHILRIAANWIQESMDDLNRMVEDVKRLYLTSAQNEFATFLPIELGSQDAAMEMFNQNWEQVTSLQQRIGMALLARIAKTQEEVKGLRDGLFNATSVNEATRSTKLNHYILVFTVVTVFYLPLSFVTALFALEAFDWKDERQTIRFIVTIILVSGATYAFSSLLIWTVRDPVRKQALTKAFVRLAEHRAPLEVIPS
ncbi:hypothetical protein B0T16DRAFT_421359 [Cercophora newfieldiana]|uniref:Uncharacterized protein n=1 Tax=Cercophora newfieldiana TaxID=92897 RepID=A0AA39XQW7_9PEZI|nr:hypothetical protein B0T16DRAFT_421359 [Cercophora newfieldiana]